MGNSEKALIQLVIISCANTIKFFRPLGLFMWDFSGRGGECDVCVCVWERERETEKWVMAMLLLNNNNAQWLVIIDPWHGMCCAIIRNGNDEGKYGTFLRFVHRYSLDTMVLLFCLFPCVSHLSDRFQYSYWIKFCT